MQKTVFLFTPPFTQLNTPYPATAYLKGFLNTKGISSYQADLGIEVTLQIFCKIGLEQLFGLVDKFVLDKAYISLFDKKEDYINTIEETIKFLQGKNDSLAATICKRKYLPEGKRFEQLKNIIFAYNELDEQDKAKHLATLYLEDISDFIKDNIDPHFGFSRYAERLGRSANSFNNMYVALQEPLTFVDEILLKILAEKIETIQPKLVGISIPFPGNLYSAFRCGQWLKANYPNIKVAFGGGFPNTELRSLSDERVFEFVDYISLDDGETPIEQIIATIENEQPITALKRTYTIANNCVTYINNNNCSDYKQVETGTPDYSDLLLDKYISAMEIINAMHKLWSDGRWNKLTMAHGCYWGKCTFCDTSLPYIKDYEPLTGSILCDRMETIIKQTASNGFHFVDEAAPPSLMRNVALEILRRKLKVTWWTNVRFEKNFTQDLCYLLAASGCIAVSGGLEVASDRLLQLIDKGITVPQVSKVTSHFTKAGIMVHAYLMYGYPTQTIQETIDSMEMVRQLFAAGVIQSGFWHRFALTSHSPIGLNPTPYKIVPKKAEVISFADNDVEFEDETGIDHDQFHFGLEKSLLNYMHLAHFDKPLQFWFDHKIPKTTIDPNYIIQNIAEPIYNSPKPTAKVVYIGQMPTVSYFVQSKKGMQRSMAAIEFKNAKKEVTIQIPEAQGKWLISLLEKIAVSQANTYTYALVKADYESAALEDFELFWENKPINKLNEMGLVVV